jgi:hypothetical protein
MPAKSQAKTDPDSVNIYISRLGWHSFGIANLYYGQVSLYEDAGRLIAIQDKSKIKKLIENMRNSEKTVVIHLILSKIVEPGKKDFTEHYNYGSDSLIQTVNYSYNRLVWTWDYRNKNGSISPEEIEKIDRYWRKRCHLK